MKKTTRTYNENSGIYLAGIFIFTLSLMLIAATAVPVYAGDLFGDNRGFDIFDGLIRFLASWAARAGVLMVFFAIAATAAALATDNPQSKIAAFWFLVGGLIAISAGLSADVFLRMLD